MLVVGHELQKTKLKTLPRNAHVSGELSVPFKKKRDNFRSCYVNKCVSFSTSLSEMGKPQTFKDSVKYLKTQLSTQSSSDQ